MKTRNSLTEHGFFYCPIADLPIEGASGNKLNIASIKERLRLIIGSLNNLANI